MLLVPRTPLFTSSALHDAGKSSSSWWSRRHLNFSGPSLPAHHLETAPLHALAKTGLKRRFSPFMACILNS